MKLVVGLGNPGKEYHLTRHNIGFMVIDELAENNSIEIRADKKFKAFTGKGSIKGQSCCLVKPVTFMNLSGYSVRLIMDWLKTDIDGILLIVDDMDLPFGDIRIKARGSSGGHKGLQSVIENIGTDEFSRIRIGIKGLENVEDLSGYVLGKFNREEQKKLPDILKHGYAASECWVKEGVDAAMNKYN
jgi:peptidyl-tRNA hydrolase, PTH1 family